MLRWKIPLQTVSDPSIVVRIAQTFGLTAANLLMWGLLLATGLTSFYRLGNTRDPLHGGELTLFEFFFSAVYVAAPLIAMVGTNALSSKFHLTGARQATIIALVLIAAASLPLLALLSLKNSCDLGMRFPFPATCDD